MNWEMLAALGQLAAVFVGIPSLIYLAIQIRPQTKERRQSAVNALAVQWDELTNALHDSTESWGAWSEHMLMSFNQPGVKMWWNPRKGSFAPGFRNFLESSPAPNVPTMVDVLQSGFQSGRQASDSWTITRS